MKIDETIEELKEAGFYMNFKEAGKQAYVVFLTTKESDGTTGVRAEKVECSNAEKKKPEEELQTWFKYEIDVFDCERQRHRRISTNATSFGNILQALSGAKTKTDSSGTAGNVFRLNTETHKSGKGVVVTCAYSKQVSEGYKEISELVKQAQKDAENYVAKNNTSV